MAPFSENIDMWVDADGLTFYRNTPSSLSSIACVEGLELEKDGVNFL